MAVPFAAVPDAGVHRGDHGGTGSSMGAVGFGYSNGWAGMHGRGRRHRYFTGGLVVCAGAKAAPFMTMSEELFITHRGSHLIKICRIMIFIASIGWLGAHILWREYVFSLGDRN